jgi:hypothetical protein
VLTKQMLFLTCDGLLGSWSFPPVGIMPDVEVTAASPSALCGSGSKNTYRFLDLCICPMAAVFPTAAAPNGS